MTPAQTTKSTVLNNTNNTTGGAMLAPVDNTAQATAQATSASMSSLSSSTTNKDDEEVEVIDEPPPLEPRNDVHPSESAKWDAVDGKAKHEKRIPDGGVIVEVTFKMLLREYECCFNKWKLSGLTKK